MELIQRQWRHVRLSLPPSWTVYLVDNGGFAFGPRGETFVVSERSASAESLAHEWSERLSAMGGHVISESTADGPLAGILRVTAIEPSSPRVVTQLFVAGPTTVTATYAAPATESYDRHEADAIIRSIRVKLPTAP